MSLSAKIRMRAEYNIKERRRLNSIIEEKDSLLKAKDEEIGSLKAQLILKEAEAAKAVRLRAKTSNFEAVEKSLQTSVEVKEQEVVDLDIMVTFVKLQNDNLVDHVHKLETSSTGLQEKVTAYENCLSQLEKFQDDQMREMNDKFDKLDANIVEMALHLEERFYPHILTTISGRQWLLTHRLELAVAKCLNSENISLLLERRLVRPLRKVCRTDYLLELLMVRKAVKKGMQDGLSSEITHGAEGRVLTDVAAYNPSAEANCLSALQCLQSVNFSLIAELKSNKDASIDTIMNLLRLGDSLAKKLGLTDSRVRRIKENIAKHRSALLDVFVSLSKPLSVTDLTGMENDYEVMHVEGEKSVGADANPFPDVDDAELNIPQ
nr:hypothetical protein [Tanacetum cinerariifolium]